MRHISYNPKAQAKIERAAVIAKMRVYESAGRPLLWSAALTFSAVFTMAWFLV